MKWIIALLVLLLPPFSNGGVRAMKVTSPAFAHGQPIPARYSCEGENISPPLQWAEVPDNTRSFAVIADDPDAPMGTWTHWTAWNLPASVRELKENFPGSDSLPDGTRQGITDSRRTGYHGPCPPSGLHHYFFRVYALDAALDVPPGARRSDVENAMRDHVLSVAAIMGTYQRKGRP